MSWLMQIVAVTDLSLRTIPGRLGSSALASLARALEDHMQLIEWDRSNTGSSDLYLDAPPEQYRWADDAALLIEHLGLGSAIFIGGSAGSRKSSPPSARKLVATPSSGASH